MIARVLPDLTKDDLNSISQDRIISTVLTLLNVSATNKYTLSSVQVIKFKNSFKLNVKKYLER